MLNLPRINLLPWRELARRRQRQAFLRLLALVVATGLLATGAASLFLWQQKQTLDAATQRLATENARLETRVKALPEAQKQLEALRAHAGELDRLSRQQSLGPILIDLLARHMPEDTWLVSVKLTGEQAEVEAAARNPLSAWYLARSLEQEGAVATVKLQQLQQARSGEGADETGGHIGFRLDLRLNPPAPFVPVAGKEAS